MEYYFDYGATSAIRPATVVSAIHEYLQSSGATPGRGGYGRSVDAGRLTLRARRLVLEILGLGSDPTRIALLPNATYALNTALNGYLQPGDAVVCTVFDHNSILRPLHHLARTRRVHVRLVAGDAEGELDWDGLDAALDGAALLVVNSVSNVLGTRLPTAELASRARAAGARVLVDAAQSGGHVVETLGADGADFVAFAGHKGLLGPQGVGGLWIREGLTVDPLVRGGTGGDSENPEMPEAMPDRLEAGTTNAPGIAGLVAGCEYVLKQGVQALHDEEATLKHRLRSGFLAIRGLEVLSPAAPDGGGIVTVRPRRMGSSELAVRLDREYGIATRSGLHCAPEVHRMLGSLESGALRFSLGWASTAEQVDYAINAVRSILQPTMVPV